MHTVRQTSFYSAMVVQSEIELRLSVLCLPHFIINDNRHERYSFDI